MKVRGRVGLSRELGVGGWVGVRGWRRSGQEREEVSGRLRKNVWA